MEKSRREAAAEGSGRGFRAKHDGGAEMEERKTQFSSLTVQSSSGSRSSSAGISSIPSSSSSSPSPTGAAGGVEGDEANAATRFNCRRSESVGMVFIVEHRRASSRLSRRLHGSRAPRGASACSRGHDRGRTHRNSIKGESRRARRERFMFLKFYYDVRHHFSEILFFLSLDIRSSLLSARSRFGTSKNNDAYRLRSQPDCRVRSLDEREEEYCRCSSCCGQKQEQFSPPPLPGRRQSFS